LLFWFWLQVLRHPTRALWRLIKLLWWTGFGLVAVVVWLHLAVRHPTAAFLAGLVFVIWVIAVRVGWRYAWPVLRPHLRIVVPDGLWYLRMRYTWPELATDARLTVYDPVKRVHGYMLATWARTEHGWTIHGRVLGGQTVATYAAAADVLRSAWAAHRVTVDAPSPGYVRITVYLDDPLRIAFRPEPVRVPDLRQLRLGRRDDGRVWTERLIGRHWLIVGATGSGKGSVQWGVIRTVCPLIQAGLVQVWTLDPKRVEFVMGWRLFARYAYEPERMVEVVEEAARLVAERGDRMAGLSRLHEPTPDEPLVVLNIDELGALTVYVTDKKLRQRLNAALGLVLTQGRAVGVCVVGAVQDPRKDIVPMRALFTTRIALRLDEPGLVDLVLGRGALARGAACHEIPGDEATGAGIGYVTVDGDPIPGRVRAAYVSDADIADMVNRFGDHTRGLATPA